jgi:hypothetical protein
MNINRLYLIVYIGNKDRPLAMPAFICNATRMLSVNNTDREVTRCVTCVYQTRSDPQRRLHMR